MGTMRDVFIRTIFLDHNSPVIQEEVAFIRISEQARWEGRKAGLLDGTAKVKLLPPSG
jgi:hypothetical protein